tara:strand:- start:42 stop:1397 length:1356 start_codon:yes stop_codon:yes gene_type:complete
MTTRTSATSGNWRADDADTWGLGLNNYPAAGEHVVIDTGHTVTLGESNDAGSIKLIGTLAGGGHTLTLNDGGDNEIFDHDGTITGTLNITITGTTNRLLDLAGSSGNVNNLTINASSTRFDLSGSGTHTVGGNLTITAGELDTTTNNKDLTVTGDVIIAASGNLTCNSSTVIVNSFTISSNGTLSLPDASGSCTITGSKSGWSLQNNSQNLSHNNGTVTQTGNGHHKSVFTNPLYNFVVNMVHLSHQATFRAAGVGGLSLTEVKVAANDVTVTRGTLQFNTSTDNAEMGSLTIGSEGTYTATSGTTTITGKESGACFDNSGTFTHNNGTVSFTKSGGTWTTIFNSGGQSFYDVNVDSSTGQAIYANDPLTILNNFTLVRGTFIANAASSHDGDITVRGLTTIGGGANATKLENDGRTLQLENVTVLSNGTIDVAEGTNNFGGIRNVGGTIT